MKFNFDVTDEKAAREIIQKHAGARTSFEAEGPGGGNPCFTIWFPRSADPAHDAAAMLSELFGEEISRHDAIEIYSDQETDADCSPAGPVG